MPGGSIDERRVRAGGEDRPVLRADEFTGSVRTIAGGRAALGAHGATI